MLSDILNPIDQAQDIMRPESSEVWLQLNQVKQDGTETVEKLKSKNGLTRSALLNLRVCQDVGLYLHTMSLLVFGAGAWYMCLVPNSNIINHIANHTFVSINTDDLFCDVTLFSVQFGSLNPIPQRKQGGVGRIPPERVFGPWEVTESSEKADFFTKWTLSIVKLIHGEKSS